MHPNNELCRESTLFLTHLFEKNLITEQQWTHITNKKISYHSIILYLIHEEKYDAASLAFIAAEFFDCPLINLENLNKAEIAYDLLNLSLLQNRLILPIHKKNFYLIIIGDPAELPLSEDLYFRLTVPIKFAFAEITQLQSFLDHLSRNEHELAIKENSELRISDFVNDLLQTAIQRKASDIHIEPFKHHLRIRMRIDGLLHEIAHQPIHLAPFISSRIKILSDLDISEKRLPQDGRFTFKCLNGSTRDCRINICPTFFGEKIVIRILDHGQKSFAIEDLGLEIADQQLIFSHLTRPQGLILVTGPTGSGKTITLYTFLKYLNDSSKNISTIEDPIEIQLEGINQLNVHPKIGLTFAQALRTFLRQDPDIIMVGEVRDHETADMAVRAAQTGHLVLSTLHTNSAYETINRLINLGIAPFNLAGSLSLTIAQRLVRKLCEHCKIANDNRFYATGCEKCHNGFKGRMAIFEILPVEKKFFESHQTIKKNQLWEAGLHKVQQGLTTLEELQRVITRDV